jgi:ubiquitin-like protein Pup
MQEQEQVRKTTADRSEVEVEHHAANTGAGDRLKAELDDLLDEIDEVLETNAEDFVRSFVQKGGQ